MHGFQQFTSIFVTVSVHRLHFQNYFFSLVIGVKLNMAVCGYRIGRMNHLKPEVIRNSTDVYDLREL